MLHCQARNGLTHNGSRVISPASPALPPPRVVLPERGARNQTNARRRNSDLTKSDLTNSGPTKVT